MDLKTKIRSNKYDRVMSRVYNQTKPILKSNSVVVTRHDPPSSVRLSTNSKPSVAASSVYSELPAVLDDYVPDSDREKPKRRLVVKPRKTLKSLDPALSPPRPRPVPRSSSRPPSYASKQSSHIRAEASAPSVLTRDPGKWSELHVRQCYSSRSHSKLKELKDEIQMYHENDKLMKIRSRLYKSCGVVLDDFGFPAADKAIQVECPDEQKDDEKRNTERDVRDDAWRQISREMGNKPIAELKKKMRSLAGGYRREKFREKYHSRMVSVTDAKRTTYSNIYTKWTCYKSKWFAYDDFDFMARTNNDDILQHESRPETRSSNNDQSIRRISKRKYEETPQTERESDSEDGTYEIETKPTPTFRILEDNSIEPIEAIQETPASNEEEAGVSCVAVDDDECELYGKLLACKLRKFKEEDRLIMMNDIDNLLFRARMRALTNQPYSHVDKDPFE